MRPDELRNLLILAGTEQRAAASDRHDRHVRHRLDGRHVGRRVHAAERRREDGHRRSSTRRSATRPARSPASCAIIPIERLNALLVITPQPAYLDEAKKWIARLDQGGSGDGPRFYVYNLQNQRAEKLGAAAAAGVHGPRVAAPPPRPPPTVAPGTPAGTIVSPPQFQTQPSIAPNTPEAAAALGAPPATAIANASGGVSGAGGLGARDGRPDDCGAARRGRGHRRRAQHPGRRRQGQQHAADRRHAGRVLGDRGGAEEARRAVAAGGHRGDDRRGDADRRAPVRRRLAVQGRRAVGARRGRQLQPDHRGSIPPSRFPPRRWAQRRPALASPRRASPTSSTTRTSPAASRRRCTCSTSTATPR